MVTSPIRNTPTAGTPPLGDSYTIFFSNWISFNWLKVMCGVSDFCAAPRELLSGFSVPILQITPISNKNTIKDLLSLGQVTLFDSVKLWRQQSSQVANKHWESGSRGHLLGCETTDSYPVEDYWWPFTILCTAKLAWAGMCTARIGWQDLKHTNHTPGAQISVIRTKVMKILWKLM